MMRLNFVIFAFIICHFSYGNIAFATEINVCDKYLRSKDAVRSKENIGTATTISLDKISTLEEVYPLLLYYKNQCKIQVGLDFDFNTKNTNEASFNYPTFAANGYLFGSGDYEEFISKGLHQSINGRIWGRSLKLNNGDTLDYFNNILMSATIVSIQDPVEIDSIILGLEKRFNTKAKPYTKVYTDEAFRSTVKGKLISISKYGEIIFLLDRSKKSLNTQNCTRSIFEEMGGGNDVFYSKRFDNRISNECFGKTIKIEGSRILIEHLLVNKDADTLQKEVEKDLDYAEMQAEILKKKQAIERAKKF